MKKLFAILLAAAMMLSLAACGGGNANVGGGGGNDDTIPVEERYGGHLNVPLTKVTALDPAKATGTWNYVWTRLIWEAPLTRDADGNICPNVCNYELSEDRLTLKLWVREGVKFHDGTDVEIDDVIASVQRAVHKSPRTQPGVQNFQSQILTYDACADGHHIGVVMLPGHPGGKHIGKQGAANTLDFVCGDAHTDTGGAQDNALFTLSTANSLGSGSGEVGIVAGI